MKFPPRSSRSPAYTLLEVMVALALFTMIVATIYSAWILILKSSAMAQKVAARAQRERIAIRTIESALICSESFQASLKYYSFVVDNSGDETTLSFTARVPDTFPRNSKFGDANLRRLNFSVVSGGSEEQGKSLVLRQNFLLSPMDDTEKQFPLVLASGVKTFAVDCWDTNQTEWVQEWKDTNAIPPLIRIRLQMESPPGAPPDAALTVVRLVAMPSQMMPGSLQVPNGEGAGAPGGAGLGGTPVNLTAPVRR